MNFNRSKQAEGFLGAFLPANFTVSQADPIKTPEPENVEREALDCLKLARGRIGQPITIIYGRGKYGRTFRGWEIRAGDFKSQHADFLKCVSQFIKQVYPEYAQDKPDTENG